ncbi:MAG: LuxR C-terminal-related transcriptional regulator [Mycobacteriales bacterium]
MATAVRRTSGGNLPEELTSFVGRRSELSAARELLSVSRLVTLTGMGGVGKTRLARRIAADHVRAFPEGVWQVELGDLHEPALVAQTVATALGLREQPGQWAVTGLIEHIGSRRMLVLLDNCEHLLDACAVLADALLSACPALCVVATSRQPLGIRGERRLAVQPLSVPDPRVPPTPAGLAQYDAVQLFLDRAVAELPGFAVTDANSRAVVQLCSLLDGIPLALELAAIRLRALSAEQIVARLDNGFSLLSRGNRSAPARQQTLRGLVDWSYELCSPDERKLWAYLSVFSGGFELDAAEAVCAETELDGIVDLVADLVDKSLLCREERDGVPRYRMVDIIAAYGMEKLREAGAEADARRRHRAWCVDLAQRVHAGWFGEQQLEWFRRVDREASNLRVAMDVRDGSLSDVEQVVEIVVPLIDCTVARGAVQEWRHWLNRCLARLVEPTLSRVRALRGAGYIACLQGDESAANSLLEECITISRQLGSSSELAWCMTAEALLALNRDDLRAALERYEAALSTFTEAGNTYGVAFASGCCGVVCAMLGDSDRAAAFYRDFDTAAAAGEAWMRSYILWARGMGRWYAGDPEGALALELESVALRRNLRDHLGIGLCLEVLAWTARARGHPELAAQLLGCADRSMERAGSWVAKVGFVNVEHGRCIAGLRAALGDAAFDRAVAAGRDLDVEKAVALAADPDARPGTLRQRQPVAEKSPLTKRERAIAELVAEGLSNREIAESLVIAQRTAEGHVEHILTKLGFRSRAQVAAWVADRKALPAGESTPRPAGEGLR